MATWNGGGDADGNSPPRSPRELQQKKPKKKIKPVDEAQVIRETEDVVKNFMAESYQQESFTLPYGDATPPVPEFTNFTASPISTESRVGRQLATIGDDINRRYANEFSEMIRMLDITPDTAYESFAGVARKLISRRNMNWGRIITLLCFGYRMAMSVLRSRTQAFTTFIKKIMQFIIQFIIKEKIAKWIADQGGWVAALGYIPTIGWPQLSAIFGLAILSVIAVVVFKKS